MPKNSAIINPNLGLYYDRPSIAIPKGGLQDGLNFRVKLGHLNNLNLGWTQFLQTASNAAPLNGQVLLITALPLRTGVTHLIFATATDIYLYLTAGGGTVRYLTPTYITGTASCAGATTAVTGSGTLWNTLATGNVWKNAKAGDQISFGSTTVTNPASTWFTIASVGNDTSITLTGNGPNTGGLVAYTIRRRFLGTTTNIWQAETFNYASPQNEDQIFLTNGLDNVVRWNGSDTAATLMTTFNFTCKSLVNFKNMMCYLNIVQGGVLQPTTMVNSDIGSPSNVGGASTGLAGQFRVHGSVDPIITAKRLGDYLGIYSANNIVMCYFTGDATVFIFRNSVANRGVISQNAVAVFPDHHRFLATDTSYVYDGTTSREDGSHVWRAILGSQDPVRIMNTYNTFDFQNGELIWSVPQTSDTGSGTATSPPAVAWTNHYLEKMPQGVPQPYSKRSFAFLSTGSYARQAALTWDQLTATWNTYNFRWTDQFFAASFPLVLGGDNSGNIWVVGGGQDAGIANSSSVTGLPSYVTFGRAATGDGKMRALLSRVYPFVDGFGTPVTVTARFADFAQGPATITATSSYDQTFPEGMYFAPIYRVGRYVDIQFGTSGPSQPYSLSGYDVEIKKGGYR